MEKNSIEIQTTLLLIMSFSLIGIYFFDFNLAKGWFNAFIIISKPYALWIGFFLLLPPLTNLISQIFSSNKTKGVRYYNEEAYYKFLKFSTHTSFIILGLFLLVFSFSIILIYLFAFTRELWVSLLIPCIIIFVIIFVVDSLVLKYSNGKVRWYNPFIYFRQ